MTITKNRTITTIKTIKINMTITKSKTTTTIKTINTITTIAAITTTKKITTISIIMKIRTIKTIAPTRANQLSNKQTMKKTGNHITKEKKNTRCKEGRRQKRIRKATTRRITPQPIKPNKPTARGKRL